MGETQLQGYYLALGGNRAPGREGYPCVRRPQLSTWISEFSQGRSWPGSTCCALVTLVFLTAEKDCYRALQALFSKELKEVG